jgi:hypothetical protein
MKSIVCPYQKQVNEGSRHPEVAVGHSRVRSVGPWFVVLRGDQYEDLRGRESDLGAFGDEWA